MISKLGSGANIRFVRLYVPLRNTIYFTIVFATLSSLSRVECNNDAGRPLNDQGMIWKDPMNDLEIIRETLNGPGEIREDP